MLTKVLIANRGEIAVRICRTLKQMGIASVAVYSEADRNSQHVSVADEAVSLGGQTAADSYLKTDLILQAAKDTGAEAIIPGYGFLSENAEFAEACAANGIAFVGPTPQQLREFGLKHEARAIAEKAGVPLAPGTDLLQSLDDAKQAALQIGYPVMLKSTAGGGGIGLSRCNNEDELVAAFESVKRLGESFFSDSGVFIERFVARARHVEVQIFGDGNGTVLALGERECSLQRRNQKVVEEAPSPFLDPETRKAMGEQSVALAKAVGYTSAGTVEFIVDGDKNFYFLEMNTRLQVEHPVTELITGVDLVEQMIRVANGEPLSITQDDVQINGWAIENRLYAEDPYRNFLPSIGRLTTYRPPAEVATDTAVVRNDTGVFEGGEISMYYDPMIAKLCTWAPTRKEAIEEMRIALDSFEIEGIGHNLPFLSAVMDHPKFISGDMTTAFIAEEYPEGFDGVTLDRDSLKRIAASAAAMNRVAEIRRTRVSGRMDNHERTVGDEWVVGVQGEEFDVHVEADHDGSTVFFDDATSYRVTSDWTPGDSLATLSVDGSPLVLKVNKITGGFRIRSRGADLKVHVRTPRQAELARLMPEKLPPDTSKMLLCPMPGLIVKIDVEEGQEVQEGQALCTVEAMKMENILSAEKKGTVSKINAAAGDSLAVDDVIMEFE